MKKIYLFFFLISLYFASLVIFGSLVRHAAFKGPFSDNIIIKLSDSMSKIPSNLKTYIFGGDLAIQKKDRLNISLKKKGLKIFINENLEEYILVSKYFLDENSFKLQLIDVLNNSIIYTWPQKRFTSTLSESSGPGRYTFEHSMLLDGGDILTTTGGEPIMKIDICGNKIWENDMNTHHSIEIDKDKNIWAPIYLNEKKKLHGQTLQYHDGIGKIDINTGTTLFQKSLYDILIENNLFDLMGNSYMGEDPLHLNDIEPVLEDGNFWKEDDLFLSLRNISLVLLYRPSTNKIIWYKFGPWRHQHDVDIIDKNKIAIFNNNTQLGIKSVNRNSEILVYDFDNSRVGNIFDKLFVKHKIKTYYEGLFEKIDDKSIYVEEQENGRIIKGNMDGNIIWEYIWDAQIKWSRFYNNNNFKKVGNLSETVKNIKNNKCS
ncbi:hypothetical protein IDG98_00585 [Pelagibacterales bacterium SAG-MED17]|nr:hypothetical protein [Pelagibacterales bacterium SAG-MED17]